MTRPLHFMLLGLLSCSVRIVIADRPKSIDEAVEKDDPDGIKKAIESGEDINTILSEGQSPLMAAVLSGKDKAVAYLLEARADMHIPEKDGYTPMHGAGFQGRPEIAKMLMEARMDPSDRHSDGYTPIHRACWGGEKRHTEFVRVLLEAGVPHDEAASDGARPIDMVRNNVGTQVLLSKWALGKGKKKATHEL
eukprot:gnl/TRDRNA2_/TRDRNA2_201342_c0_seq1.p1 gnl/TRDRNA2_/TRDRNA2_201342_c0~~gnl/TRDRNA2_/TRDRNA2_201342_c0_seq1.p1  ORF type:complete len:193 (-),score=40.92 gnl/TRDRNA2_/TRDRNA2_201342_c0_seq1:553-1131(-)